MDIDLITPPEIKTETVWQCDADGLLLAAAIAFDGALPWGAVDVPPPPIPEGHRARWTGEAWALEAIPTPPVDPPAPVLTLEEARALKISEIDAQTSAAITAGFGYQINGDALHFSYDLNDQQNFADTANAATLFKMGVAGIPAKITWNGWRVGDGVPRDLVRLTLDVDGFLTLYMQGALAHKAACMAEGTNRKAALEAATTLDGVEAV